MLLRTLMLSFRRKRRVLSCLAMVTGLFLAVHQESFSSGSEKPVYVIQLNDDTINPVTAGYIVDAIARAQVDGAECLIIKMDTPGGLLNSTRMIVKSMLTATVPVVVYIAPNGSRAGSAGVFITYASHIAAMAPSTNIGAAHPIQYGIQPPRQPREWGEFKELLEELKASKKEKDPNAVEGDPAVSDQPPQKEIDSQEIAPDEDPMSSKILQDTVAFVKAIAKERNRNVEWAVLSVVKSESITAAEALEKGVVDLIAHSDDELLRLIDGRKVQLDGKEVVLKTAGAPVEILVMDARQRFFNVLANPNIAYILMILGFYGLLFEVTHPGFGVPGVLGIVFLILAFYSMQTLPTNYAGLALILLAIVLFIAEVYTPTFGILTLGGLSCMILGSMLLFDTPDPIMRVSASIIYPFSITTSAVTLFLLYLVMRSQRAKVRGGAEGLIGEVVEAIQTITPGGKGKVFVHGEIWNAVSSESIVNGEEAIIESVKGLTLTVKKQTKGGGT